jgi:predicted transcriptional regulator
MKGGKQKNDDVLQRTIYVHTMLHRDVAGKRIITFRVDDDTFERLKEVAEGMGMSISGYVRSSVIMRIEGNLVLNEAREKERQDKFRRMRGQG